MVAARRRLTDRAGKATPLAIYADLNERELNCLLALEDLLCVLNASGPNRFLKRITFWSRAGDRRRKESTDACAGSDQRNPPPALCREMISAQNRQSLAHRRLRLPSIFLRPP
jgi:hypothetical protein